MPDIPIYQAFESDDIARLSQDLNAAYDRASAATAVEAESQDHPESNADALIETHEVPVLEQLIGIDPAVYRQINAGIKSGKQHLMFYGPPGTGKTTLAQHCASALAGSPTMLITGSADWSSQD